MGLSREEAIVIGKEYRTELLAEWSRQLATTARRDLEALSRRGLSQGMLQEFGNLLERVTSLETAQETQKKAGVAETVLSYKVQEEALGWWREAKQIVKVEFGNDADRLVEFRTGVKVGRSIPRLIRELEFLMPAFERYRANLGWLGVADFLGRGRQLLGRLKQAESEQESARKQLPRDTAELYWKKGELYDLGRKIVRLGRLAFLVSPDKAAAYNYDMLRRGQVAAKRGTTRKLSQQKAQ